MWSSIRITYVFLHGEVSPGHVTYRTRGLLDYVYVSEFEHNLARIDRKAMPHRDTRVPTREVLGL